ncbi:MAG: hypothetical protein WAJ93_27315 [Candidatus Nitrosopolaris sp.]
MGNVVLIVITAIMPALTSLFAHVIDKLLEWKLSAPISVFNLREQIKEAVVSDSVVSGGNNTRYVLGDRNLMIYNTKHIHTN